MRSGIIGMVIIAALAIGCATVQKGELEAAETAVAKVVADLSTVAGEEYENAQKIRDEIKAGEVFAAGTDLLALYKRLEAKKSPFVADVQVARAAVAKLFTNDEADRMKTTEQVVNAAEVKPPAKW